MRQNEDLRNNPPDSSNQITWQLLAPYLGVRIINQSLDAALVAAQDLSRQPNVDFAQVRALTAVASRFYEHGRPENGGKCLELAIENAARIADPEMRARSIGLLTLPLADSYRRTDQGVRCYNDLVAALDALGQSDQGQAYRTGQLILGRLFELGVYPYKSHLRKYLKDLQESNPHAWGGVPYSSAEETPEQDLLYHITSAPSRQITMRRIRLGPLNYDGTTKPGFRGADDIRKRAQNLRGLRSDEQIESFLIGIEQQLDTKPESDAFTRIRQWAAFRIVCTEVGSLDFAQLAENRIRRCTRDLVQSRISADFSQYGRLLTSFPELAAIFVTINGQTKPVAEHLFRPPSSEHRDEFSPALVEALVKCNLDHRAQSLIQLFLPEQARTLKRVLDLVSLQREADSADGELSLLESAFGSGSANCGSLVMRAAVIALRKFFSSSEQAYISTVPMSIYPELIEGLQTRWEAAPSSQEDQLAQERLVPPPQTETNPAVQFFAHICQLSQGESDEDRIKRYVLCALYDSLDCRSAKSLLDSIPDPISRLWVLSRKYYSQDSAKYCDRRNQINENVSRLEDGFIPSLSDVQSAMLTSSVRALVGQGYYEPALRICSVALHDEAVCGLLGETLQYLLAHTVEVEALKLGKLVSSLLAETAKRASPSGILRFLDSFLIEKGVRSRF